MKPKFILPLLMLASTALSAVAQSPSEVFIDSLKNSHKVITFGRGEQPSDDSIRKVINEFYVDQFRHYEDPAAP